MRLKSKWHNKARTKSPEEIGGAVAFNAWGITKDTVNKMFADGFNFKTNAQILDVMAEFCAFFVLMTDRWTFERVDDAYREALIKAMALKLMETMQENRVEEQGEGAYQEAFLQTLNNRLADYSEFNLVDGQPTYPFLRLFGQNVEAIMGGETNKWVQEQIMEVETPAALKKLRRVVDGLIPGPDEATDSTE